MASGASSLQDVLAKAKETEKGANKYQQSVEKQAGHKMPQSQYQAAYKARKNPPAPTKPAARTTGEDIAKGLDWNKKQVDDYTKQYGPVE